MVEKLVEKTGPAVQLEGGAQTKGERTRERILDFAYLSIVEKGFAATSIEELVEAAGITTAAGGDASPSWAGGVADAIVTSLYSDAEPSEGATPNRASAVPIRILFMDHLLSKLTSGQCAPGGGRCQPRSHASDSTPRALFD
jgi:hypothetical protein